MTETLTIHTGNSKDTHTETSWLYRKDGRFKDIAISAAAWGPTVRGGWEQRSGCASDFLSDIHEYLVSRLYSAPSSLSLQDYASRRAPKFIFELSQGMS